MSACVTVLILITASLAADAEPRKSGAAHVQNSSHFRKPPQNSQRETHNVHRSYENWQNSRFSWKVGNRLPEQYHYSDFLIDYRENTKLSTPTRFQQWVKISDQYLLINIMTNTILQIIPE